MPRAARDAALVQALNAERNLLRQQKAAVTKRLKQAARNHAKLLKAASALTDEELISILQSRNPGMVVQFPPAGGQP